MIPEHSLIPTESHFRESNPEFSIVSGSVTYEGRERSTVKGAGQPSSGETAIRSPPSVTVEKSRFHSLTLVFWRTNGASWCKRLFSPFITVKV
jgi:hypothetical protein